MSAFFNGVNCDIYIGRGAGKKLLDEINKAKKNVKIISPYLSPSLMKELIQLNEKGIEVNLITSDKIDDFYGNYEKNNYKLIKQHRSKDVKAERIRNKWIQIHMFLLYGIIGLFLGMITLLNFTKNLKFLYLTFPILLLFIIKNNFQKRIKNYRIYSYSYSKLFPFKVFVSPHKSGVYEDMFIHSKIYIIDDELVYLGSLNFTDKGTKSNHETRIRITDKEAILKVIEEYNSLFYNSNLPERDAIYLGRELYREPIN
ncbi:phospholipase D family protein [Flavobacterium agricola]|uniref:phospholipase D n=1 Tax=Flavobacterium agricola TaxID=2870839 RepID=A0ABY6M1S5_9FLAO|nr:phospholipase D family protein [Flavobacterium agricola]UYW02386.1 phospholipase D family protein [Flavobacterium agricola]